MFDAKTAAERRDAGQQLSMLRSGSDWIESAISALGRYVESRRRNNLDDEFTFEQFRTWAVGTGLLDEPASLNTWGSLPKVAARRKIVEYTGRVREARRPASHARMIRIWRAL